MGKCISSKDLIPAKKIKYFDENGTTVIVKLTILNHFQVNKKDASNKLLSPKLETEDLITNSCIFFFEYSSIQPSKINMSHISSSTPTLYREYQTKLTGDGTSESVNNINSIQESDKCQSPKLTNETIQPIPLPSSPLKTVHQSKEKVESSIIEFNLETPSIKSDKHKPVLIQLHNVTSFEY